MNPHVSWLHKIFLMLGLCLSSAIAFSAQEAPQTFTFDGRAFSNAAATTALLDSINVRVQILNQAQDCILYEEQQSVNTTATDGYFTIQVGSVTGAAKRSALDSNHTMSQVFSNTITSLSGKLVSNGAACTYSPLNAHVRYVRILMTPSDGITRAISPNMALDSVPYALAAERADTLQGLYPTDLLLVNNTAPTALTQANLEAFFTTPAYTNLQAVAAGNYVQKSAGGASLPQFAGAPGSPVAGNMWYDSTANQIKYYNGTSTQILGTGSSGSFSGISAAVATDTIDNTNYAQNWNWSTATTQNPLSIAANALTTGSILNLTSSSASLNSTSGLLNVANTSASTTGTVARIQANSTAGSGLTVLANGSIGIATASPQAGFALTVNGSNYNSINSAVVPGIYVANNYTGANTANPYFGGKFYNTAIVAKATAGASETGATGIYATGDNYGYGLYGENTTSYGGGVTGMASYSGSSGGQTIGVYGESNTQNNGAGVYGKENRAGNIGYGVYSYNDSASGWSMYADGTSPNYFNGNVGIGTTTPKLALDVNGGIRPGSSTTVTTCGLGLANGEGTQRYNYTTHNMQYCNGSTWVSFVPIQTTPALTAPAGSGYFVLTATSYDGNLGGSLAAADAKCLTELTVTHTSWMGYATANSNGQLVAAKVHAFICAAGSTCNNPMPLTTYYFANAANAAVGGASFTTDGSSVGPNDNNNWSAANYFGGTYSYWTNRDYSGSNNLLYNTGGYNTTGNFCSALASNSSGNKGAVGASANIGLARWNVQSDQTCDLQFKLICFVNP